MILDDLHVDALRSQLVKSAARQFIERNLGANDLMAVIFTGGRTDAAQEFTSNKRLLLASVDQFMGRKLRVGHPRAERRVLPAGGRRLQDSRIPDPYEQERAYNAQGTMRSLRQVAEWFGGVRGRRKTMLFISEGIDYDVTDIIRAARRADELGVGDPRRHPRGDRGHRAVERQHLRASIRAG